MSASMIKKPEYNGQDYSWIWIDREFVGWFTGVMNNKINPCDTPAVRAIEATDPEQAFTEYIRDVGEYLINIAECRLDTSKLVSMPKHYSHTFGEDNVDDFVE